MRLSVKKSKNKIYYYALDAHREGNKVISNVAFKIGEHSELLAKGIKDPLQYAKDKIDELNNDKRDNKLSLNETYDFTELLENNSIYSKSTLKNIGYIYIHKLYEQLGVKNFLDKIETKAKFNLNEITEYYVINRFLFPGSKREAFLNRDKFFNAPSYALHDGYRSLTYLDKYNDELQQTLFEGSKNIIPLNTEVLYYDCTNFYFECEEQDDNIYNEDGDIIQWGLRRYGASKEHRPNPIVQMGLFTDKNGIPISYCVHHGSNNEQNTVIPLETKIINNYKESKFIYCSDGGLGSFDNRFINSFNGRNYVVTQSLKKTSNSELDLIFKDLNWKYVNDLHDSKGKKVKPSLKQFKAILDKKYRNEPLTPEEEFIISRDMLYKAYPIKRKIPAKFLKDLKLSGTLEMEETIYITFSAKYYLYQKQLFDRQVATAQEWINTKDPDNIKKGPSDVRRFIKTISSTKEGEVANEKINILDQEQIDDEMRFHGFYAVATSLENKTINEILNINASRWKIEQSFRILKTDFDARPIYASTQEHIKAHFAICYMALLIYRIMESKLLSTCKEGKSYSTKQILDTIKNMNVLELSNGYVYKSTYGGSDILDSLEKIFNVELNRKHFSKKNLMKKFKN